MFRIACAGDNCVDYYDEIKEPHYGGNPLNVGVYFHRLGGEASFISVVGTDEYGPGTRAAAEAMGVDCSHLRVEEGTTAITHVTMENGNRVLGDYEEGVMENFVLRDEDLEFIKTHDLMVSALWGRTSNRLAELKGKILIAFDFADRPYDPVGVEAMPSVDIAFFSDDNTPVSALKTKLQDIAAHGPKLVVATRGSQGSLALYKGNFYECGISPCHVVDTMGAGDSYIAGFLYQYMHTPEDIPACMKAGADNAAKTLSHSGAW